MRRAASLGLALLLTLGSAALAAPGAAAAWFALEPGLARRWRLAGDAVHGHRLALDAVASRGQGKAIFVLLSKASPSYTTGLNTILRVLEERGVRGHFTVENYDGQAALGLGAIAEINATHPALVFAIGSDTTAFMLQHYRGGAVPVVSAEAKDPVLLGQVKDYAGGSGTNFAFTSLNVPVALQLDYMKRLVPGLRNIGVIYAASNTSAISTQVKPLLAITPQHGVAGLSVAARGPDIAGSLEGVMRQAVRQMRLSDPTLRHSVFWIVGATEVFGQLGTINRLAAGVPVLSAVPDLVTAGPDTAALAIGITFEDNAYLAAVYGAEILAGRAPGAMPVGVVTPPDIAINFRKAREAHLAIPFDFFETATRIYDARGRLVRDNGQPVSPPP